MRKILTAVAIFLASMTPILAQGFVPAAAPPWVYADNYGRWAIQGQTPDSYSFSPASVCQINQLNFQNTSVFFAFGSQVALAPVLIADVNGANSEVVTPGSAATQTAVACSVNISPVNSHTTFSLQSGTGGLQEAINALGASTAPYPTVIYLTPQWYKLVRGIASLNSTLAGTTGFGALVACNIGPTSLFCIPISGARRRIAVVLAVSFWASVRLGFWSIASKSLAKPCRALNWRAALAVLASLTRLT